jgi:hypothetical protein
MATTPRQSRGETLAHHHFIEMPPTVGFRPYRTQVLGNYWPEFKNPPTDRFIADHKSALSQKILDIPIAQREPEVEPDSMSDDVRWKSVAGVGDALARWSLTCQCPAAARRTGAPDNADHKTNEERHCETNFRSGHGRRSP